MWAFISNPIVSHVSAAVLGAVAMLFVRRNNATKVDNAIASATGFAADVKATEAKIAADVKKL